MNQQLSSLRSQLLDLSTNSRHCSKRASQEHRCCRARSTPCGESAANPTAIATAVSSTRALSCPIAAKDGRGTSRPHPGNSTRCER